MMMGLPAAAIGVFLGLGSALLWRSVSSRVGRVEFWSSAVQLSRSLIAGENDREFLRQYVRLLHLLARYLGRQALVLGVSFLPVTLFLTTLGPDLRGSDFASTTIGSVERQPVAQDL